VSTPFAIRRDEGKSPAFRRFAWRPRLHKKVEMLFSIAGTRRLEIGLSGRGGIGHVFFRDRLASSPFQPANARFVTDDDPSALEQRFASPFHR
jgi:hypothetical protein